MPTLRCKRSELIAQPHQLAWVGARCHGHKTPTKRRRRCARTRPHLQTKRDAPPTERRREPGTRRHRPFARREGTREGTRPCAPRGGGVGRRLAGGVGRRSAASGGVRRPRSLIPAAAAGAGREGAGGRSAERVLGPLGGRCASCAER